MVGGSGSNPTTGTGFFFDLKKFMLNLCCFSIDTALDSCCNSIGQQPTNSNSGCKNNIDPILKQGPIQYRSNVGPTFPNISPILKQHCIEPLSMLFQCCCATWVVWPVEYQTRTQALWLHVSSHGPSLLRLFNTETDDELHVISHWAVVCCQKTFCIFRYFLLYTTIAGTCELGRIRSYFLI